MLNKLCFRVIGLSMNKTIALSALSIIVAIFLAFHIPAEAQDQKVVGYWQFEEGGGQEVEDSSGMGNHGEIVGDCEWVDGKFKLGLHFNGEINAYVRLPNEQISESLLSANALTMAAWLKPKHFKADAIAIINDPGNYFLRVVPQFAVNPGVHIGGWKEVRTVSKRIIKVEKWYHVAGTYDGEILRAYLNGELTDSFLEPKFNGDAGAPLQAGGELVLGSFGDTLFGSGVMDEVLIANYAFTEGELNNLMESGISAVEPAGKLSTTWSRIKAGY